MEQAAAVQVVTRRVLTDGPARFRLIEDSLSDESKVFAVHFTCDYDFDREVTIDCEDEAAARDLIEILNRAAVNIAVDG